MNGARDRHSGLFVLDKPQGMTSRQAVDAVARLLPRKTKVGHAGTLDPLATGVLVLCVGSATRLIEFVQRMRKSYRATIRLGARSDTDDAEGKVLETPTCEVPALDRVQDALRSQLGEILQVPPRFAAVKVGGRRAYELSRKGQEVELSARVVRVDRLSILEYQWPELDVEVDCGSGTYIRSIARDVGESLGCGGLIQSLRRTRIGPFSCEAALDPRCLSDESVRRSLLPAALAVGELPSVRLGELDRARVLRGQVARLCRSASCQMPDSGEVAMFGPGGELLGVGEVDHQDDVIQVQPRRVLWDGTLIG